MEEVEDAIKGRVDNWRYERRNAHLIHVSLIGSDKAVSIYDALPLPYDEELTKLEEPDHDEIQNLYDYARSINYFDTPLKVVHNAR